MKGELTAILIGSGERQTDVNFNSAMSYTLGRVNHFDKMENNRDQLVEDQCEFLGKMVFEQFENSKIS